MMSMMVIPLETSEEDDDGWGQYIKIDIQRNQVQIFILENKFE